MNDRQTKDIRRMTLAQRFAMWYELSCLGDALWEANLERSEIERRWQIWRREHDLSDENMLRCFRESP